MTLEIQKYLRNGHSLIDLENDFAIKNKIHSDGLRVIVDYDMIKSPKAHTIVREARGLVLEMNTWNIVAKGFFRFFNAGEYQTDDRKFNWDSDVLCTSKEDGSLILLYNYRGVWYVNTRFSWADSIVNESVYTWTNLVKQGFDFDKADLNPEYTYVMEVCSLFNKVVRAYSGVQVFLLSVFHGETELNWDVTQSIAIELGLATPFTVSCKDIMDVQAHLTKLADGDPSFEGFVVRDCFNNRLKIKSPTYLALHRLNNNGNIASVKNLLPLIMAGETSEVLTYFNELQDCCNQIQSKLDDAKKEIDDIWYCHHDESSQKRFAEAIKHSKYSGILFNARKLKVHPLSLLTSEYLIKVWNE